MGSGLLEWNLSLKVPRTLEVRAELGGGMVCSRSSGGLRRGSVGRVVSYPGRRLGMKGVNGGYLKTPDGFEHRLIIYKCGILLGQVHLLEETSEVRGIETQIGSCEDFKEKRWLILLAKNKVAGSMTGDTYYALIRWLVSIEVNCEPYGGS